MKNARKSIPKMTKVRVLIDRGLAAKAAERLKKENYLRDLVRRDLEAARFRVAPSSSMTKGGRARKSWRTRS